MELSTEAGGRRLAVTLPLDATVHHLYEAVGAAWGLGGKFLLRGSRGCYPYSHEPFGSVCAGPDDVIRIDPCLSEGEQAREHLQSLGLGWDLEDMRSTLRSAPVDHHLLSLQLVACGTAGHASELFLDACGAGCSRTVTALLECSGAGTPCGVLLDTAAQQQNNATGLMMAAAGGHLRVVQLLVSAGVTVDMRDGLDWTAAMHASFAGHARIATFLQRHSPAQPWVERAGDVCEVQLRHMLSTGAGQGLVAASRALNAALVSFACMVLCRLGICFIGGFGVLFGWYSKTSKVVCPLLAARAAAALVTSLVPLVHGMSALAGGALLASAWVLSFAAFNPLFFVLLYLPCLGGYARHNECDARSCV